MMCLWFSLNIYIIKLGLDDKNFSLILHEQKGRILTTVLTICQRILNFRGKLQKFSKNTYCPKTLQSCSIKDLILF